MSGDLISLISVDRDAVPTNRGFYYQYLNVVLKWITHYVNDDTTDVYTEVGDDIKEVGGNLVFTQLKCYTSVFNFNSSEIKKAMLNFFSLYLEHRADQQEMRLCFTSNSRPSRNDKLLKRWIDEQPPLNGLLTLCKTKVCGLLYKEVKQIRDKQLSKKKLAQGAKALLTSNFNDLNDIINDDHTLSDFINCIRWEFENETPEQSIKNLVIRITEELCNPKFGSRPVKLLFNAMLSEIYRKSQLNGSDLRKVTYADMQSLIKATDDELKEFIDNRLVNLFNLRLELIENSLSDVKGIVSGIADVQRQQGELIDKLILQGVPHHIPQAITRLPFVNVANIVGRAGKLAEIQHLLSETRHVSVNGNGGMGKSTMLKYFLRRFENEYDHTIWISAEQGLINSFSVNQEIADALQLPVESEKFEERFAQILSRLKDIQGNNLLVIDSYNQPVPQLDEIRALASWRILLGTRQRLTGWQTVTMDALSFDDAKKMYADINPQTLPDDNELSRFFDAVEYNTLTIGLVARTILNSLDLTLAKVMEHFEAQNLDDVSLQIDLPDEYGASPRLLNILRATFDLTELDEFERYFINYFALLPVQETDIADMVDWFGKRLETENRTQIINAINKLHTKGLVERNGRQFAMHKMLQQTILYQERQTVSPFVGQVMLIIELTARLHEGADHSISQALRFLKYGEAILENIKEPFRRSVYQPMLKLENEVLNIYNWLYSENNLTARYNSLYERTVVSLGPTDSLTGVIANNYGLTLVADGDFDAAMKLFDEAAQILEVQAEKALPQLLTSLCNLCHLFIKRNEMKRFGECFAKMKQIRDKNKLWKDTSLPIQASVLGIANKSYGNYVRAQEMFNLAINLHLELPPEKRNDLQLVSYVLNATECYILTDQLDKAENAVIYATNILSKINAADTIYLGEVTKYLILICEIKGEHEEVEKLKQVLKNMGYRDDDQK